MLKELRSHKFIFEIEDEGVRAVLHVWRWKSNVWQKKLLKE